MEHIEPKIMIGVPTSGYSRNDRFYDYFNQLDKPDGSLVMFVRGQSPARNRNIIIDAALDNDCSHIMFIDDDMAIPKDALFKLLSHDVDVVTGLYLMRSFPHQPVIFDQALSDGRCVHYYFSNSGNYNDSNNRNDLVRVVNCGFGCCLIKTSVLSKLSRPFVRLGQTELDHWGDDIDFFNRVRSSGFQIYCDLTVLVGHMGVVTTYPVFNNGKWFVKYDTNGTGCAMFEAISPTQESINLALMEAAASGASRVD